jgi:primosomal protein N' (replication factor Y) (superfamily II helicase)
MIASVAFDAPIGHPFSYRVPPGVTVVPGQRVRAPLGRAPRVGLVLAVQEGAGERLKPLQSVVDAAPSISDPELDLVRWIAAESFSSIGSTALAFLPPPLGRPAGDGRTVTSIDSSLAQADPATELFVGSGRERALLDRVAHADGSVLVVTADVEAATRWAQRLGKMRPVARLDSGVTDGERAAAWDDVRNGRASMVVGTRSALLVPLPSPAQFALIDEHDPAHRPPGHPRIHSREILVERARRQTGRLLMTAGTPSVEMWHASSIGAAKILTGEPAPWPSVSIADTRGILRREPLTPELARAMRETLAAGGRVFLGVSRFASALACDECGLVVCCDRCGVALAYSRAAPVLTCRLCTTTKPPMGVCPGCAGHRLSPFGWGVERVEHAVRRRFPRARVVRYDPEARGIRRSTTRAVASEADVVIGTRGGLKLFGPSSLGLAGLVSPDQLLRLPDFRAGERLFALLWAAAERVKPGGAVIVQSQNPSHHAFAAVIAQSLERFYRPELEFRAELGYPPFRRLAVVTIRPGRGAPGLVREVEQALRGAPTVAPYPATTGRRRDVHRIVVKGGADLPDRLAVALADYRARRPVSRGIIDVEVDPVEWQS